MSARNKLNQAYVNGALLIAGVCGAIGQSWSVFTVVAGLLLVLNVLFDEIRFARRKRR